MSKIDCRNAQVVHFVRHDLELDLTSARTGVSGSGSAASCAVASRTVQPRKTGVSARSRERQRPPSVRALDRCLGSLTRARPFSKIATASGCSSGRAQILNPKPEALCRR
jgi:hypothetical protein